MTRGRWVVLGFAVIGSLSAGAALAADDGPTIELAKFSVDDQTVGAKQASCGKGKRALGGGVVQSGSPSGLAVQVSGPLGASGFSASAGDGDPAKRWHASVANNSGVNDRELKVLAICAAHSDATIAATRFTTQYRVNTEGVARCGPGERALGGGVVQIGPQAFSLVRASGPADASGSVANTGDGDRPKQWRATVYQADTEGREFKVFAICAPNSQATIETTRFTVSGDESREVRESCGTGERVLGGGVAPTRLAQGSFDQPYVEASGPLDASGRIESTRDGDAAKQWYAAVKNDGAGNRPFKVFAVCSRGA